MQFNETESMFELGLDPDRLRQIATQMELTKKNGHMPGQVIRVKLSHNFCVAWRPSDGQPTETTETKEIQ